MGLLLRGPVLLLGALHFLLRGEDCSGSSSHALRYFSTGVSEPGPGLPRYIAVGYVDGQLFVHYDSDTKRALPRAPWMEKVGEEDPQYWDVQTQRGQVAEAMCRADMASAMRRCNHSRGLHTWQLAVGCELSEDRPSRGYQQYAYDGRDFIAFNKQNLTWTAAVGPAEEMKRRWEADPATAQGWKGYLEEECIVWLRKYLRYGRETLLRKEPPVVKVARKDSPEGVETLLCQAHGFYPKKVYATWRKDGEVREGDTFRGVVSPNSDGTYYTWLSIDIDPTERSRFRCHVEHDGLLEPLDVAVEEAVPVWLIAVGVVLVVVLVFLLVAGVFFYTKKHRETGREDPTEQQQLDLPPVCEKSVEGTRQSQAGNSAC